jgi:hypothetical protein
LKRESERMPRRLLQRIFNPAVKGVRYPVAGGPDLSGSDFVRFTFHQITAIGHGRSPGIIAPAAYLRSSALSISDFALQPPPGAAN